MSSSSSSESLPQELLVEILSRVSVRDLTRFRCVSKWWNSLVFDPTFVKLHLQKSSRNTRILLTFNDRYDDNNRYRTAPCSIEGLLDDPLSTIDGSHLFHHDHSVVGVCNGLVCLSNFSRELEKYTFRFWNPATRVISRYSPNLCVPGRNFSIQGFPQFGFGYDDRSDSYKVVAIIYDRELQKMVVKVHYLGDICWRNILSTPHFPVLPGNGAFVSDTVNWLALPKLRFDYVWNTVTTNDLVIMSYDLKNDTYRFLSMPNGLTEVPPMEPILKVLKGCLCFPYHHGRTHFGLWLMREFGVEKSWTHLLNINYEQFHIHDHFRRIPYLPAILCVSENDDVMLLANYHGNQFVKYNMRDNRIDHCVDFNDRFIWFLSFAYVQSLVMPYRN